jgi:hypothetical protein
MPDELHADSPDHNTDRWNLIRDIAVLQVKLVVDGLRDLILVPVSLVVGIYSVVKGGPEAGKDFYDLLRLGRKSERWINLFGAVDRAQGNTDDDALPLDDIDDMVTRVESFIVDEYKSGGVTRQAKIRLDQAIDVLHRKVRKSKPDADQ